MESNPYEPPKQLHNPNSLSWRSLWRRICLGSVCSVGTFVAASWFYEHRHPNATGGDLYTIIRGLLALGELVSWVMVAVGGIGWILSRRSPNITPAT